MITDEKYVVLSRETYDRLIVGFARDDDDVKTFTQATLDDAVVIRRRDIFAPPALDAYANSIRTAIEGMKALPQSPAHKAMIGRLQGIADYFHEQATLAWEATRKLPD